MIQYHSNQVMVRYYHDIDLNTILLRFCNILCIAVTCYATLPLIALLQMQVMSQKENLSCQHLLNLICNSQSLSKTWIHICSLHTRLTLGRYLSIECCHSKYCSTVLYGFFPPSLLVICKNYHFSSRSVQTMSRESCVPQPTCYTQPGSYCKTLWGPVLTFLLILYVS